MNIDKTDFEGLYVLSPQIFKDHRGSFMEAYNQRNFKEVGLGYDFVQDNISQSKYGVLRGLHFQKPPYGQTKLITVLKGEIQDIAVDIRPESLTFGKYFDIKISSENKISLLVPKGFAHGFLVLSETADIFYKVDTFYTPEADSGIRYNDPKININWMLDEEQLILSEKDLNLEFFEELYLAGN